MDTSIATRFLRQDDPQHGLVERLVRDFTEKVGEIVVCPQVVYKLRVVLTRPASDNGFNVATGAFEGAIRPLLEGAALHPDPPDLIERWLAVCARHGIVGKRSHDARLVARMEHHGVDTILTLNPRDFRVFPSVAVLTPGTL